jgi:H+/Na+-translocating ferredoxin:NAD+ oxidoreductase subunit B
MEEIYKRLSAKLGYPDSEYLPKIFECAVTLRQAKILEELNQAPAPALTAEQLAEKTGLDAEVIRQDLDDLFYKGLAFPRKFEDRREWRYGKSPMQLHDAMISGWRRFQEPEKLFQLWHQYDENEGYQKYGKEFAAVSTPMTRIIPAVDAVANDSNLQPWEDWREILKSKRLISVVDCPCRLEVKACDRPVEVCLDFDRTAEYDIASRHGRKLSVEEALDILKNASRSGLVHTAINDTSVANMCNCCNDCCVEFQSLKEGNVPLSQHYAKSRYEASIDQNLCTGCQDCVDNCNFDAITMVKSPGSKKLKAQVDIEACYGCGCCFMACEQKAISMKCVRPVSHVPGVQG